jgi:hypothetical protein
MDGILAGAGPGLGPTEVRHLIAEVEHVLDDLASVDEHVLVGCGLLAAVARKGVNEGFEIVKHVRGVLSSVVD